MTLMQGDSSAQPQPGGGEPPKQPNQDQENQWQYEPGYDQNAPAPLPPQSAPIPGGQSREQQLPSPPAPVETSWTASEYINHAKGVGWYAMLILIGLVVAGLIYIWTKDIVSCIVVLVMVALLGIVGGRKPRVLQYRLDHTGLTVGNKLYPYTEFKSFSVMDEGAFSSIMFVPMKRFMPPLSIYYAPEDEERVIATLSQYVPMKQRNYDVMDRLARRIRF